MDDSSYIMFQFTFFDDNIDKMSHHQNFFMTSKPVTKSVGSLNSSLEYSIRQALHVFFISKKKEPTLNDVK